MASAPRRAKKIAFNRAVDRKVWMAGVIEAWTTVWDSVAHAVVLSHAKGGFSVLMFPDASDEQ